MVAASFWSLLNPAIDLSEKMYPDMMWMPAAVGFLTGALFLFFLDKSLPHLHINFKESEKEGVKTQFHKTTLLVLAITLHNIPEGLAVGVLFGASAHGIEGASVAGAVALAIGIGIQNFPEGFAVAMPLRRAGATRFKSFWYGQLSAIVEPIAGVVGASLSAVPRVSLPKVVKLPLPLVVFIPSSFCWSVATSRISGVNIIRNLLPWGGGIVVADCSIS